MTPEQLYVYTEETYLHAHLALLNHELFLKIVTNEETRQNRITWMYLQSFLSHFGMVSKLLFAPSARNPISRDRARALRDHLDINEASSLNDRNARNAIEHLDERMDNWLAQPDKGFLEMAFPNRKEYQYLDP